MKDSHLIGIVWTEYKLF